MHAPVTPPPRAADLLAWYDRHRRDLPWRAPAGVPPDPYHVWLSEIMLQQTTVATVRPHFDRFLALWPTVRDLAAADLDAVLHAWQGLGYYARARNMHRCAQTVASEHDGRFPADEATLLTLPGVGAYTAAAIAAIAFDRPATVVDGNVERVMARLFAIHAPLPAGKKAIRAAAESLTPRERPGDYAQAVMDLGATVCSPRKPRCMLCPWADRCAARALGIAETLPRQAPKAERPTRRGVAFWIQRPDGAVLLRRRRESGLLGGMMEIPSTEWVEGLWSTAPEGEGSPLRADWRELPGLVRHGFTHFLLELWVLAGRVPATARTPKDCIWVPVDRFGDYALPTVMKKVVRHTLAHL